MSFVEYREKTPPPDLASWVECAWTLRCATPAPGVDRVLPDGRVEIVVNLAEPMVREEVGGRRRQPVELLVGPTTRAVALRPTGAVDLLGIRLRPGGAGSLLRTPLDRLTDRDLPLDDVLPTRAGLRECCGNAAPDRREAAVWRWLRKRLDRNAHDASVAAACAAILRNPEAEVGVLAGRLGMSTRTLRRRFRHGVGMGPKRLARLARFQRVVGRLAVADASGRMAPWFDAGYADQSHFLREFREFVGMPPGAYFHHLDGRIALQFLAVDG